MACRPSYRGNRLCMDCITCGLGLGTGACINSHLHTISTLENAWKTMRYEEETIVDLDEQKSKTFLEYVGVIRQIETLMLDSSIYGHPEDEQISARKTLLKEFYDAMFQNPAQAVQLLKDYSEPTPSKSVFLKGHQEFAAWVNGILDAYSKTRLYMLCAGTGDLRASFLSLLSLKSMPYSQSYIKTIPPGSQKVEGGEYPLEFGINVSIYRTEGSDSLLYVQQNNVIENLSPELSQILKDAVNAELKESRENADYSTIFEEKMRQFRQQFLDSAQAKGISLSPSLALSMGREAASWSVGLGSPIENIALDRNNITDIYIDAQNAAIYLEHQKFGLCHTVWQYNQEMLERAFRNIVSTQRGARRFDKENPIIDVVLTRLAMRCHLQRPPATFGDMQAALRIMKQEPFTYAEYLKYNSFTPFFAGYDDVMVGLGCSEAVLGLKGVGKTMFTSAKIAAIGPKRRILPLQDIEEIPVQAYRKRGFHIGAIRVLSSEREDNASGGSELDLVSMTNASLRMGDACVIINEIRSRTAIQGVINMLNTQPGIFLLYNLHAQSLKDIQDRLELVFGMPAASMYSTDRYSFLKKMRFGRSGRMFRMLGSQFESDLEKRQFVPIFTLERAESIDSSLLTCNFCALPEASAKDLYNVDLGSISKKLKLKFIPPALKRRADESGNPPEDYVMEAFYKGKLYDLIYHAYLEHDAPALLELDFVLKCLTFANLILEQNSGKQPNWAEYDKQMCAQFEQVLSQELADWETTAISTGQKKTGAKSPPPANKTSSSSAATGKTSAPAGKTPPSSAQSQSKPNFSQSSASRPPPSSPQKSSSAKSSPPAQSSSLSQTSRPSSYPRSSSLSQPASSMSTGSATSLPSSYLVKPSQQKDKTKPVPDFTMDDSQYAEQKEEDEKEGE